MSGNIPGFRIREFDANGEPLAGGKLYTYQAGTTTPKVTYSDSACTTPNTNPVILDSEGAADVWILTGSYKFVLTEANDAPRWTKDNIPSLASLFGDTTGALVAVNNLSDLTDPAEALVNLGVDATAEELNSLEGIDSNVQVQLDAKASTAALTNHTSNTANPHSVTKTQVGLSNVDNTSDATKNSAVADLSNKTFIDAITLEEQASTPSSPSSGDKKFYAKNDGKLYTLNSSGEEVEVGSGASGQGQLNYIENGNAETNTNGWTSYADGTAYPISGGESVGGDALTRDVSNIIRGVASFTTDTTAGDGDGYRYDFTIDDADLNKQLYIRLLYRMLTTSFNGNWSVWIYDVDNTELIKVFGDNENADNAKGQNLLPTSSINQALVSFQATGSKNYRLLIHNGSAPAGTNSELNFDEVLVGPDSPTPTTKATKWESYTPEFTGFGTPTNVNAQRRIVEGNLVVRITFTSGTPTATEARVSLGYTTPSNLPTLSLAGAAKTDNTEASTDFQDRQVLIEPSVDYLTFAASYSTYGTGLAKGNGNAITTAGAIVSLYASIPIEGNTGNLMSSFEASQQALIVTAYKNADTHTGSGSYRDVVGWTKTQDNFNAFNITTGVFTAPKAGTYIFSGAIGMGNASGILATIVTDTSNNVLAKLGQVPNISATSGATVPLNGYVELDQGEEVKIRLYQDSGGSLSYPGGVGNGTLTITRKQDYHTFGAYSEDVGFAAYLDTAGNHTASGVWQTVPSAMTEDFDTHDQFDGFTFTCKIPGIYTFGSSATFGPFTDGKRVAVRFNKNSGTHRAINYGAQSVSSVSASANTTFTFNLRVGDTVIYEVFQDNSNSTAYDNADGGNYFWAVKN